MRTAKIVYSMVGYTTVTITDIPNKNNGSSWDKKQIANKSATSTASISN